MASRSGDPGAGYALGDLIEPRAALYSAAPLPSADACGRGRARLRSISLDAIGAATPGKPRVGSSCPTSPNSSASVRSETLSLL